jgi:hypothetical protein
MFIDEWYAKDFYKRLPLGYHQNFVFGQIFWTHAYYPHENLQLWRPVPTPDEPTKTIAKAFQLQAAGKDAFDRSIPLHVPKLETNEEFVVIRAKRRPVMLIQPETSLIDEENKGFRGRIRRNLCLVAQIFGLADAQTGRQEFNPAFVDRVRRMEFSELMFLPKQPGILEVDSFLRLDEVQSVFVPHLDPTSLTLGDEMTTILRQQFQFLITGIPSPEFTTLREMLLED